VPFIGSFNCEQCPKQRGAHNHWFVVVYRQLKDGGMSFSLREMAADEKPSKENRYLCSKACVDAEFTAYYARIEKRRADAEARLAPAAAEEVRTQ